MKVILSRLTLALSSLCVIGCAAFDGSYPESMAYGQSSYGRGYCDAGEPSPNSNASSEDEANYAGAALALGLGALIIMGAAQASEEPSYQSELDANYERAVNAQLQDNWNRNGNINDYSR
jgi:hypothetical protein